MEATEGGSIDGVYEGRYTCLMISSRSGHLDICRLLIDKGAQVKAKNRINKTPLHYAAGRGYFEIVCLICDHGADVEARNEIGWTPLHYAAMGGYTAIVKELIEVRNADINARDVSYWTPRWWARNNFNANVAAYLAAHGGIF